MQLFGWLQLQTNRMRWFAVRVSSKSVLVMLFWHARTTFDAQWNCSWYSRIYPGCLETIPLAATTTVNEHRRQGATHWTACGINSHHDIGQSMRTSRLWSDMCLARSTGVLKILGMCMLPHDVVPMPGCLHVIIGPRQSIDMSNLKN